MDQSQGDRSGYHSISGIGHHFGPAGWLCGTNSLDQISTISTIKKKKPFARDRMHFSNL